MRAAEAWRILRSRGPVPASEKIPTLPAEFATGWGEPRFALGASGEVRVLVPVADDGPAEDFSSQGALSIRFSRLWIHDRQLPCVDLLCCDPSLETVFGDVVDEILARLKSGHEPARAVRNTLSEFRELLEKAGRQEVTLAREAGLVAELYVLNRLLDHHRKAWQAWVGPLHERHDFRCGGLSLEVKASTRLSARPITINSIEQLEAPQDGELYLAYLVLERVADGDLTVQDVVEQALPRVDDVEGFLARLRSVGCAAQDAPEWNRHQVRLGQFRVFEVREGFPRIVPSMLPARGLPAGVLKVTYEIEIAAFESFGLPQEVWKLLERRLSICQ